MRTVTRISPITKKEIGKLRVAAYCRVSTSSADQLNSYATQIRVYTSMIKKREEWELVEIFADEGLTGTKAESRKEFQRMIKMCELGQIDLIIVKSVSRFARNTKESLEYCRKLKLLGVGVQFEKEGINTLSLGDEMLLNVFSAIAQEESIAISKNVRFSVTKRMENGTYVDSNAPYGFCLINKKLCEFAPQSEVVKRIFNDYLNGMSASEIARQLQSEGVPTKRVKATWTTATITYILSNEKYVGDSLFQKSCKSVSVPFKKYKNRGEMEQYYASNTHEGFIDKEVFNQVQKLLELRKCTFGKTQSYNKYLLTSHIRCTECGSIYRRKLINNVVKWCCVKHLRNEKDCNSHYYLEERIYDGIIAIINNLRFGNIDILARTILKLESIIMQYKRNNNEAYDISRQMADLNAKLLVLEQLRNKGYLADDVFGAQSWEINQQMIKLKEYRKQILDTEIQIMLQDIKKLKGIMEKIEEPLEKLDEKLFRECIEDISINNKDEMTVTMLGGLKFTEVI